MGRAKRIKKKQGNSSSGKSFAKFSAIKASSRGITKARTKSVARCSDTEIDLLAQKYADVIFGSKKWKWRLDIKPGLSAADKIRIRDSARNNYGVPTIPVDANEYPDFTGYVEDDNTSLPGHLWGSRDSTQFNWLNNDLKRRNPSYDPDTQTFPPDTKKYTWHHHQDRGRMQLVEFGVHNATNHKGGRTTWATGPR